MCYMCTVKRQVFNDDQRLSILCVGSKLEFGNEFRVIRSATENTR